MSAWVDLDEPLAIWIRRARIGWTASLEDFDEMDGLGATEDEALDRLAHRIAAFHEGGGDFKLHSRSDGIARWFSHWAWRLRKSNARPVRKTMTMRDLLARAGKTP